MEITVNEVTIGENEIARETQYHPAGSLQEARRKAAQALAVRALLLQRAASLGLRGDTDEERIAALIASEVSTPHADDKTCRRYYETNRRRFRSSDLFEARHILFAVKADDTEAFPAARARAEATITVLRTHPERFAALAKELSACSSGKQGGNLGQITRGSTVPEFETFLMELTPGQLCPVPIRSRYGYHVLRLDRRIEGKALPFETAQAKIAAYLEERVWRQAVRQYIELLAGSARITGVDLRKASSPLVQ